MYSAAFLIFQLYDSRYNLGYLKCTIKNVPQDTISGTSDVKLYALSSIGMYYSFILKQSLPYGCRTRLFSVRLFFSALSCCLTYATSVPYPLFILVYSIAQANHVPLTPTFHATSRRLLFKLQTVFINKQKSRYIYVPDCTRHI